MQQYTYRIGTRVLVLANVFKVTRIPDYNVSLKARVYSWLPLFLQHAWKPLWWDRVNEINTDKLLPNITLLTMQVFHYDVCHFCRLVHCRSFWLLVLFSPSLAPFSAYPFLCPMAMIINVVVLSLSPELFRQHCFQCIKLNYHSILSISYHTSIEITLLDFWNALHA